MGKAVLPNINALKSIGIDAVTGLPQKVNIPDGGRLNKSILRQLRILDEQDAVNRFTWYNLPNGINGQMLERMLYYRGQVALFYMESTGQFFILPYALNGQIDCYGRYLGITPLPFSGQSQTSVDGKVTPWISGLVKKPVYEVPLEMLEDVFLDGAVLLKDYTPQLSENIISRQVLQDDLLDAMSETIPFARTALIANSGVRGVRVQDEDQAGQVQLASQRIQKAALTGNPLVPIVGTTEFQDLTNSNALKSEEYLLYLQALDNYRLSLYGLDNGGLFQKKSHMLEAEQSMNSAHAKLAYQDCLTNRQRFCDIVNSIWGLGIWCEPSESVLAIDMTGDGIAVDKQDQSGMQSGEQPEQTMEEEE